MAMTTKNVINEHSSECIAGSRMSRCGISRAVRVGSVIAVAGTTPRPDGKTVGMVMLRNADV
jgi:hypothetical protein